MFPSPLGPRLDSATLLLAVTLLVLGDGCARTAEPATMPELKAQTEAEVLSLLPGVWKLRTVDGEPAQGWLTFRDGERGRRLSFSLICGEQDGSYVLQGNTVHPTQETSVGPNCDQQDIARSPIRVPALLDRPFQVNVDGRWLIARGRGRTGSTWARYVRSSVAEMLGQPRR